MAPKNMLSREQKRKAPASESNPVGDKIDAGSPLDDFNLIHRDALMDTASLDLSQRILVSKAALLFRGEGKGQAASDDEDSDDEEESLSNATEERPSKEHPKERSSEINAEPVDVYPIRFYPEGIFERQEPIPLDQLRPLIVEGQDWGKTTATWSTVGSVKRLFRECGASGVTFLVPNDEQRPWTPPLGYQCVYESYFWKDTKIWFPIPRLITLYCFRRDVVISQFINGSFRIAVALMTMAEEADISMSVRTFEELTTIQPRPHGLFFVKMRPSYNIITGHQNKTENCNRYYFYVKSDVFAFEESLKDDYRVLWNRKLVIHPNKIVYLEKFFERAQAIATLSHIRWPEIIDWRSDIPCPVGSGKKCLELFPKPKQSRAKRMRKMPDLSALVGGELGTSGDNPMAILDGMSYEVPATVPILAPAAPLDLAKCEGDDADRDGTAMVQRRRKRSKDDLPSEGNGNDDQGVPSDFRTKKRNAHSCVELVRQIRGGPREMPQVSDLIFADTYVDAARSSVLGQGRMNLVVMEYDRALKHAIANMKKSEESLVERNAYIAKKKKEFKDVYTSEIKERDEAIARRKAKRKKAGELSAELEAARAKITSLEEEKAAAEQEKAATTEDTAREIRRLKRSRSHEVTLERVQTQTAMIVKSNRRFANIMDYIVRRDAYDEKFLLLAQASGTKKCFELIREKGTPIPQDMIEELEFGEIPESDLCLSPLILQSQFLNEALLGSIDPFGSNTSLIDPSTASSLQTHGGSLEARTSEGAADDPTGIEEGRGCEQEERDDAAIGDATIGGEANA
ncbi:hypothetical protein N665_0175s0006 [Sinapis alba]|nr:hypothetical protein N665_0175s0006 [Sinapis alba]